MLRFVGSDVLGNCPAQVYMDSGTIEINADVWDNYDEFQKAFILEHEKGHFNLRTDSETKADRYALNQVYGTVPRSLKRSIEALKEVGVVDNERYHDLYVEALKIDARENNNERAKKELKTLGISKMNVKRTNSTSPFIGKNRVDGGDENAASAATLAQTMRDRFASTIGAAAQTKKTGFTVKDHFISYEAALLAVLVILMIRKG